MSNYDAKSIITHSWPELARLPDGRWKRTWTIALKEEPVLPVPMEELSARITEVIVEDFDSWFREHRGAEWLREHPGSEWPTLKGDLTIELRLSGSKEITASLMSVEDGQADEYMIAAWDMLEEIDSRIGTIETIDDDARDSYPPFSPPFSRRTRGRMLKIDSGPNAEGEQDGRE